MSPTPSTVREGFTTPLIHDQRAQLIRHGLGLPADGARVNVALLFAGAPNLTNVAGELVDVAINRDTATVLTITVRDERSACIVVPWHAVATVTNLPDPTTTAHPAL